MKVLVHLNHGVDKSYLLNFGKNVTKPTISRMLKDDKKDAVESLLKYALIAVYRCQSSTFDNVTLL